ncbi:hypothetical protein ACQCX5_05220 [Propionibacteriaceae bacterium G57]|uniref:hypothetical protein n=1 Tax=Aestuariimicrobium sp. G57 TaxID=3418485 RepID=UPI003DA7A100
MKSCGSFLMVAGGIVLFISFNVDDPEVVLPWAIGAIGLGVVLWRFSKKGSRPAVAGPGTTLQADEIAGWSLERRDHALVNSWNRRHDHLPNGTLFNLRQGRAHQRQLAVFQATEGGTGPTFLILRTKHLRGPDFTVKSSGDASVSLEKGAAPAGLQDLLNRWRPDNYQAFGLSNGNIFWVQLGTMTDEKVIDFIKRRLTGIAEVITQTVDAESAAVGSPRRQTSASKPRQGVQGRTPQDRPAAKASQARPASPAPRPRPAGIDPTAIVQTGPIEQVERPALQRAAPDRVAAELENPLLAGEWKPMEWEPTPFTLSAPMGISALGQPELGHPELGQPELGQPDEGSRTGWTPRPWTPPDYGSSATAAWKPAEAWQPNYDRPGSDHAGEQKS